MNKNEVMQFLQEKGNEQTKNIYLKHGAKEPFYGVKIQDLKIIQKKVKKDQVLAEELYATGNSDAMYLAGLIADPQKISKETLQQWAKEAYWYMIAEYTVSGVAASSPFAIELANEWIHSEQETIATAGWATWAAYLSVTPNEALDLEKIDMGLNDIAANIHQSQNRVRYAMNNFVICVGGYVKPLHEKALEVAQMIGKVSVDMGGTACKVPLAYDYILKMEKRGSLEKKKRKTIC